MPLSASGSPLPSTTGELETGKGMGAKIPPGFWGNGTGANVGVGTALEPSVTAGGGEKTLGGKTGAAIPAPVANLL